MRAERNFTHEDGRTLVNLDVIDQPTDADLAVMLVGQPAASLARIRINACTLGSVLITSTNRSDVERVLDLLGLLPEVIEDERWNLINHE